MSGAADAGDRPSGTGRFPFDGVDPTRGPTASQEAGLTIAAARAIIATVIAEARTMHVAMSCAIVDAGGQLVAFERMDGADLVTITLAQDKAWTALVNRMPTGDLAALAQPGAEYYGYDSVAGGRTIIFDGGLPLECDGILVGGVGVSGGDSAQDAGAATSGVRAFERGPRGAGPEPGS
jgi:uncharacterized protein GlcG (DUF336 family)